MKEIYLGKKIEKCEPCESPAEPSDEYFQSLHFSVDGDIETEFPEEGTITLRYKKMVITKTERNGEIVSSSISCDVEAIEGVDDSEEEEEEKPKKKKTIEDIIQAGIEAVANKSKE